MKEGDILLAWMLHSDGSTKLRPALFLKQLPPFNDVFACGVSTRLHHLVSGFDELIRPGDSDFQSSGLLAASIFRLGFLGTIPHVHIKGRIGDIAPARLNRLLTNLADHLRR